MYGREIIIQYVLSKFIRAHPFTLLGINACNEGQSVAELGMCFLEVIAGLWLEGMQHIDPNLNVMWEKWHLVTAGMQGNQRAFFVNGI